ncbi:MAG: amino acid ABC transporter ATP-binding protein [Candidatus Moranbacteria bacterium]|nr:amino acid ABC transporter ATP-binding protein [Candidatus Moranbacteria bacterium]
MNIKVENLSHTYQQQLVLNQVNLDLKDVEAVAIVGPSGAGKSTLLRLLSKIETIQKGKIVVNGFDLSNVDAKDYYKNIGFVFQTHNLFPHLTSLENIMLVLEKVHQKSEQEARTIAVELLTQFELVDHMHKKPHQLSGGQAQRVSIIRSLSINPQILFLDEPTSSLDPVLTQEVLFTILKLKEEKMNFVIVTHEILFAKKAADYVLFMEAGKIVEHGDVGILDHPKTDALRHFLETVFMC